MPRLLTALALFLVCNAGARADTEVCQTVNGRTTCTHAEGNVSCISINGETRCTPAHPDSLKQPMPDMTMPGVEVREENGRTKVTAGGTEIWLPK